MAKQGFQDLAYTGGGQRAPSRHPHYYNGGCYRVSDSGGSYKRRIVTLPKLQECPVSLPLPDPVLLYFLIFILHEVYRLHSIRIVL